jgi:hypothetical protein
MSPVLGSLSQVRERRLADTSDQDEAEAEMMKGFRGVRPLPSKIRVWRTRGVTSVNRSKNLGDVKGVRNYVELGQCMECLSQDSQRQDRRLLKRMWSLITSQERIDHRGDLAASRIDDWENALANLMGKGKLVPTLREAV